jgi:hypothetical protein
MPEQKTTQGQAELDPFALADKFEKENPQIMEAMKLFDVSFADYQNALNSFNNSYIYTSASTVRTEQKENG